MKKKIKAMNRIALSGIGLSAMASANTALGGTNLVGGFTQGYGKMMPAVGSMMGVGMTMDAVNMMRPRRRKRR